MSAGYRNTFDDNESAENSNGYAEHVDADGDSNDDDKDEDEGGHDE